MADNLTSKVEHWLNSGGFPLEYQVNRALRAAGLKTIVGSYRKDENTGKLRELDVIAFKIFELSDDRLPVPARVTVAAVIECKKGDGSPAVIFRGEQDARSDNSLFSNTPAGTGAEVALLLAHERKDPSVCMFFLSRNGSRGHAIRTANLGKSGDKERDSGGKNKPDAIYSAAVSVEAACRTLTSADDNLNHQRAGALFPELSSVALPVVVWGGRLFDAAYNANTQSIQCTETKQGLVDLRGRDASSSGTTIVEIVQKDAVSGWADDLAIRFDRLEDVFRSEYQRILRFSESGDFNDLEINLSKGSSQKALQVYVHRVAEQRDGLLKKPRF